MIVVIDYRRQFFFLCLRRFGVNEEERGPPARELFGWPDGVNFCGWCVTIENEIVAPEGGAQLSRITKKLRLRENCYIPIINLLLD